VASYLGAACEDSSSNRTVQRRDPRATRVIGIIQIGHRDFTEGQRRAVLIDDDGNQWVHDDACQPVFGVWLAPDTLGADPPVFMGRLDDGQHLPASEP